MADVTMPQLGETVTEGTITKWFKKVGDRVEADEILFEVSTDKVDSEVAAPAAGVLAEIRVAEGTTVDVGVVLAVISSEVGAEARAAAPAPPAPEPAPPAPAPTPVVEVAEVVEAAPTPPPTPVVAPAPTSAAATPVAAQPVPAASAAPSVEAMEKVLSPVVRKLINENGLDPNTIVGTGIGGRITREDVQAVLEARATRNPTPPSAAVTADSAAPTPAPVYAAPPPPASVATPAPAVPAPTPAPPAAPAAPAPARKRSAQPPAVGRGP